MSSSAVFQLLPGFPASASASLALQTQSYLLPVPVPHHSHWKLVQELQNLELYGDTGSWNTCTLCHHR